MEVAKKKKTRAGHRASLSKMLPDVDDCLADYSTDRKTKVLKWRGTLVEQLEKIEPLDVQILSLMDNDEKATEDDMANETGELSASFTAANESHTN